MPYLTAVAAGLLIGLVRRGRLAALADVHFRDIWLVAVGALLWLVVGPLPFQSWLRLADVAPLLLTVAHLLLLVFVWRNRKVRWLPVLGAGLLSNTVVMIANGGQMPVDPQLQALLAAPASEPDMWLHYRPIDDATRFAFLGDVFFLGSPLPWVRIVSIGDLLIMVGATLFVQHAMSRESDGPARQESSDGWHGFCKRLAAGVARLHDALRCGNRLL